MMTHIDIDIQDEQEAARVLSLLNQEHIPHQVQRKPELSEEERAEARGGSCAEVAKRLTLKRWSLTLKKRGNVNYPFGTNNEVV